MTFQPLTMQRAIRDDAALTAPEKGLLLVAVLRTDNGTRRVRASLQRLAEDAGLGYRTARRAFAPTNEGVLRYFEKVERGPRFVNLTFCPSGQVPAGSEEVAPSGSHVTAARREVAPVSDETVAVAESTGQGGLPSAPLHATPSAHGLPPATSVAALHSKEWTAATAPSLDHNSAEEMSPSPVRDETHRESVSDARECGPRRPLPADRPPRGYRQRQA